MWPVSRTIDRYDTVFDHDGLVSNAGLLKPEKIRDLHAAGLSSFIISIDAASEELHEENRKRQAELMQMEAQVEEHSEELIGVKKKEEEWKLELAHFQRQKGMVTNEREFTAVISRGDSGGNAIGRRHIGTKRGVCVTHVRSRPAGDALTGWQL